MRRFTIAMTAAPLDFAKSTVRLVSVVVPDWLMATMRWSDISLSIANPDSSEATIAVTEGGVSAELSPLLA